MHACLIKKMKMFNKSYIFGGEINFFVGFIYIVGELEKFDKI
jgi:hypothetical protein